MWFLRENMICKLVIPRLKIWDIICWVYEYLVLKVIVIGEMPILKWLFLGHNTDLKEL